MHYIASEMEISGPGKNSGQGSVSLGLDSVVIILASITIAVYEMSS